MKKMNEQMKDYIKKGVLKNLEYFEKFPEHDQLADAVVQQISKSKNIDTEILLDALELAVKDVG